MKKKDKNPLGEWPHLTFSQQDELKGKQEKIKRALLSMGRQEKIKRALLDMCSREAAREREACAKLAESASCGCAAVRCKCDATRKLIAAGIRARST